MAWIYLLIAALFEVGWAIGLKYTHGFSRPWPSAITITAMAASLFFLALSIRTIPLGTGYAIWTGLGAVGVVTLGVILFGEPLTPMRVLCLMLILAGVVGLKIATP